MVMAKIMKEEKHHIMVVGEEIKKIKGGRVNKQTRPYCKLCKKTNHNTNNCRYKCKRCKKHTYLEKDY